MRSYIPVRQLLFIMLLFSLPISINAQYVSPNDKNGNRRSAYDIKAEEARNKQNNSYKPSSAPAKTPSRSNDVVVPAKTEKPDYGKYDLRTSPDENGMQIVKLNGKWGFVSIKDEMILPLIYEKVIYRGKGWYEIISGTKSGLANKQGQVVIPCQFNLIYTIFDANGQAKVNRYGQVYFINEKGEPVLEANQTYSRHEVMGNYKDGMALVSLRDIKGETKYGFLDSTDKIKIPLTYDNAYSFYQGIALVKSGTQWGAINKTGEITIPIIYKKIDYVDNLFMVSEDIKVGVIDGKGKIIIPLIYEQCATSFSEGCISMKLNNAWGYVDSISGQEIVPFKYASGGNFREGLAVVTKQEKMFSVSYGFVNKAGTEVIPFVYEDARGFYGGLSGVMQKSKWGFIDQQQNLIVKFIYEDTRQFNEGLAAVKLKGKWGYINRAGKMIIPCRYDNTYAIFNEGQISVQVGEKWGSINNKGEETIAALYTDPFRFVNGEAYVRLDGKSLFINKQGIIVATQQRINGNYVRVPLR